MPALPWWSRVLGFPAWLLALGVAGGLAVEAIRANREAALQHRRREAVERDVARTRLRNAALQAEIRSLEEDAMYLESLQQERKRLPTREKVVGE